MKKTSQKKIVEFLSADISKGARMAEISQKKNELVKFLLRARTKSEICQKFGFSEVEIQDILKKGLEGYNLFWFRKEDQEEVYKLVPKIPRLRVKKRVWKRLFSQDEKEKTPYLMIQFPDEFPRERIIILPSADVHLGAKGHDEVRFDEHLRKIKENENFFTFINGDFLENALKDSPGSAIFEQVLRPREQIDLAIEKLRPIAHKVLWAISGHHEFRSEEKCDLNPLEFVCAKLGIPYFNEPIFVDIFWAGYVFSFYCSHGTSWARTEGGKLSAASRPLKHQGFRMFTVSGHVHDKTSDKETRITRLRQFNEKGELIRFELVQKKQYIVICPSFYKYRGTYAARSEYSPVSRGGVACILFRSGDYHVPSFGHQEFEKEVESEKPKDWSEKGD